MSNKGLISISALAAVLVLFFAVNIVAGRAFTGARADLTEGKLFTLSPGSRNIAKGIQEPITLTLYLTQKSVNDLPSVKSYAQRVREMLEEYARTSGGKVILRIVDPEPFSEAEDKAVAAGIGGLPTGRGDERLYFGLVGTNSVDRTEVIPFFSPEKEEFLEYDIAKLIYNLSDQPRKTIGLMTWLPLEGSEGNPMMGNRGGAPEWQIHKRLKDSFDLKSVATNAKEIPADVTVLVIVHPKSMPEPTQYAVDQFVMRGGRVVVFVDPNCESDVPPGMNQFQAMQVPKNSELPKLLAAWGVEMEKDKIATDKTTAVSVNVGQGNRPEVVPYIAFFMLDKTHRSATDPVTGQLERLFLGTPGILKKKDGATTDVQPLIMTSNKAMPIDSSKLAVFPEPKKLLAEYTPGDKELWLAVRATGKAKSAFAAAPADATPEAEKDKAPKPPAPHLAESTEPINVVVVADCDMLTDRFWINESRLGNLLLGYDEFTDNGTFAIGAVDHLSGSTDLIGLRARGKFARPFTKMEELKQEAQQQYHAKELELQKKLADTERQINELQQKRPDAKDTRVVLTAEQNKKVEEFRAQMVQTRKDLRDVKFNLDKDTRSLQARLMALNIGLMPTLVGIFALGLAAYRTSRRAADRQTASKG